jgi:hypothetical protein
VKWLGGLESSIHSHEASPTLIEGEPRCDRNARDSCNWTRCGVVAVLFAALAQLFCCSAGQQRHHRRPRAAMKRGLPHSAQAAAPQWRYSSNATTAGGPIGAVRGARLLRSRRTGRGQQRETRRRKYLRHTTTTNFAPWVDALTGCRRAYATHGLMSVQIRPTIRRRWVDCMGVHDASDELARLSLYGGQGTPSRKQVVQRHLEELSDETGHAIRRLEGCNRSQGRSSPPLVSTALSSDSTRLPHRALQALANQQPARSSASNSDGLRSGPVRAFQSHNTTRHAHSQPTRDCFHREALHTHAGPSQDGWS